jgi:drug/metabolite transporter (DMT)-like permease
MSKISGADRPLRSATLPGGLPVQASESPATERPRNEKTSRRRHLTVGSVALVLLAVATAATAQVMLKHGMNIATARSADSGSLALRAATSPWVLFGLVVFGISALAWLAALSKVPLAIAYPFNALGYIGILIASILILHERANVLTWVGSVLVVSGLVIVVLSQP